MSVVAIADSLISNFTPSSNMRQMSQVFQDFKQLGQDLQAGNLPSAQQAYASMQSTFSQFSGSSSADASSFSLSA